MIDLSISRIIAEICLLVLCAAPLVVFQFFIEPFKRGFYCDDSSIRYPLVKSQTVPTLMLTIGGVAISLCLIVFTELYRCVVWEHRSNSSYEDYRFLCCYVHRIVIRLYIFIGYCILGMVFNQIMASIAKYSIGRPRPHFFAACQPEGYMGENCTTIEYVTDFKCMGTNRHALREARLSFYSGHASFSFYCAWYIALFMQARLYRPLCSRIVLPSIQFFLFCLASFVAYSRISDYMHHWSDVLCGAIAGSACGIFVAVYVVQVFRRREIPKAYSSKQLCSMVSHVSDTSSSSSPSAESVLSPASKRHKKRNKSKVPKGSKETKESKESKDSKESNVSGYATEPSSSVVELPV